VAAYTPGLLWAEAAVVGDTGCTSDRLTSEGQSQGRIESGSPR
jgi:hypothetical protein